MFSLKVPQAVSCQAAAGLRKVVGCGGGYTHHVGPSPEGSRPLCVPSLRDGMADP